MKSDLEIEEVLMKARACAALQEMASNSGEVVPPLSAFEAVCVMGTPVNVYIAGGVPQR